MSKIKILTSIDEYVDTITNNENKVVVIKVGATWCGPCNLLEKKIEGLNEAKTQNVVFAEIDIDSDWCDEKVTEWGINTIPVLLYFVNGIEVDRTVGLVQEDNIYERIKKYGNI